MADELIPLHVLDSAIEDALNDIILQELKAGTPVRTTVTRQKWKVDRLGLLDYDIVNTALTEPTKSGPNIGKQYPIITLLTQGTLPHVIKPVDKKVLAWQMGSQWIHAMKVNHPGFAARLWIFYATRNNSLYERFEKAVWNNLKALGVV